MFGKETAMNRLMMKNLPLFVLAFLFSLALGETSKAPAGWDEFGDGVTLTEKTPIKDILAAPESFAERPVAVEGEVVGVCKMMGCWIELQGGEGERLRVKVDDGVIVFPETAQGRKAIAQGVVERLEFSREEAVERARHEAEETGREFDPETVTPPYREIRLRGTGAWIESAPQN